MPQKGGVEILRLLGDPQAHEAGVVFDRSGQTKSSGDASIRIDGVRHGNSAAVPCVEIIADLGRELPPTFSGCSGEGKDEVILICNALGSGLNCGRKTGDIGRV